MTKKSEFVENMVTTENRVITENPLIIKNLGLTNFEATWHDMQRFTEHRHADTPDEIWLTEHAPVYTLGLNRKDVRLPIPNHIPLVLTDRGGKITYHGPGQVIVYILLDLKRRALGIRQLVIKLENAVIELLAHYKIAASIKKNAPGVYVLDQNANEAKIASLGLRIKNNCCYHGLSLNVNMDLTPFSAIDPCGYIGLKVTQISAFGMASSLETVRQLLIPILTAHLACGNKHD